MTRVLAVHLGLSQNKDACSHCVLTHVRIEANKRCGVSVFDQGSSVEAKDCTIQAHGDSSEGGQGIAVVMGARATIVDCTVKSNSQCGIFGQFFLHCIIA